MKNLSLMWKQFIRFFVIIVLTAGLIIYFTSREIRKNYLKNLEITLENYAQLIEKFIRPIVAEGSYPKVEALTRQLGNELGVRCTIVKVNGVVLGDSEKDPLKMDNHSNRPEIINALQIGYGTSMRYSDAVSKDMLYVAIPIVYNDNIIGAVRTSSFLEIIQRSNRDIIRDVIGITLFIILLALILSIITTETYTKPLRDIAKAANRIKGGDFKARLYTKKGDELGLLADSLNEMARELEKYFTTLNQEREGLKTIISSMVEALVVLHSDGTIITANKNFAEISRIEQEKLAGKRYWEFISQEEFKKLIEKVIKHNNFITEEITIDNHIYLTSCAIIKGIPEKRIIVVMHDISELKRLEEVKSDFVANVAHELKTPLTAIKGFAETLEAEADEKNKKFIKIIHANTERLIKIVSDLLILSNVEHKKERIKLKKFKLENLIQNSLMIENKKLEQKKIDVIFEFENKIPQFKGDPFLIEQMMINLLDNAITYTEKRGKIQIDVSKEDKMLILEIEDNGIGIPAKHLPRIFERFYVVDKSRSRKFGGTGLGLSIVKHIVLSHDGEISVESRVGEGTKFKINLPY